MALPKKMGYKDVWKVLDKLGYKAVKNHGSHILMVKPPQNSGEDYRYLTLICHKQLAPGTLLNMIREMGLTKEEFLELL